MARNISRFVQYGCGWSAPDTWRNFDVSPTLRFERVPILGRLFAKNAARFPKNVEVGDIIGGLPIAPGWCDGVYCSHVLEHLALDDFRLALRNTRTILKPGGVFRLVLPDLESLVQRYLRNTATSASIDFMSDSYLGVTERPRGLRGALISWLGNSKHLWMWDYKSMRAELAEAGFVDIRRASFNDSSEQMFVQVEAVERWDDCLGVECRRPA